MTDDHVRVRFAPSPTGFFHIGSARTALFNWLYARHTNGTFVLRIEDTDDERDRKEYLDVLLDGLRWLGLQWDEGPDVGGDYGPYFQSQRSEIYKYHVEMLKNAGRAYDKDGAVYFKVSGEPQTIHDRIRGDVVRKEEKDFVIVRSNGKPVFHLVNVVDDMLMRITHVIRGEDHLSNTSKHVELFKAFGAQPPVFAHIPLILKSHGTGKMSKRDTGALIEDYEKNLFISDAVRNYLCLLGWSPKNDREILPIEEIVQIFDIADINKNNARFDEKKMSYFNTSYLRTLQADKYCTRGKSVLQEAHVNLSKYDDMYVDNVLLLCQEKLRSFSELPEFVSYFFSDKISYDETLLEKLRTKCDVKLRVKEFYDIFSQSSFKLSEQDIENYVHQLAEKNNTTTGEYIHSVRFAVSGRNVGPSFFGLLHVLPKSIAQQRMENFMNVA